MAASAGAGSIDDFGLRGSSRCRQMGVPLSDQGWLIQVVHAFDNPNTALSEGEALPAVVQSLPGNPRWKRVSKDSPRPLRQNERGCAPRVPSSPGASVRRTRGVLVEGATPPFWTLVRHRRALTGARSGARLTPASGGRSLHSDPCGKASGRPFALMVDECLPV